MRSIGLLLLTGVCGAAWAQPGTTFRTGSRVVLVDTVVTDKHGKYVRDLTKAEFHLWEDDKEQAISSLSFQPAAAEKRYLVFFFDDADTPLGDRYDARQAAGRFLDSGVGEDGMMAIAEYSQSLRITQSFTNDRVALKSVLHAQRPAGGERTAGPRAAPNFATENVMLALRHLAKQLADVPGRKTVIFLSAGFGVPSGLAGQFTAAIDACNYANVAVYPIDVRGISRAQGPADASGNRDLMSPADHGVVPIPNRPYLSPGMPNPQAGPSQDLPNDRQPVLRSLAKATGGFVILNTNDLVGGMNRIGQEQHEYYLLGYTPPNEAVPGTCHTLKVRTDRSGVEVRARSGYCDRKPMDLLSGSAAERTLEELAGADARPTVAASMACPFFYLTPGIARVHVVIEIPAASMRFEREKGRYRSEMNVLGVAYLPDGSAAARFSDTVSVEFDNESQVDGFRRAKPYRYEKQFKAAAGSYTLKVVFSSGRESFGKLESPLVIDAWDGRHAMLSSLALGTEVHPKPDTPEGLGDLPTEDGTPLTSSGLRLAPSGTNRFRASDQVYFYGELYNSGAAAASIELLDPKSGALERKLGDVAITGTHAESAGLPFLFALRMETLKPGPHGLRVTIPNSGGRPVSTRTADFEVVP